MLSMTPDMREWGWPAGPDRGHKRGASSPGKLRARPHGSEATPRSPRRLGQSSPPRRRLCSSRQRLIRPWSPERRTSGTSCPRQSERARVVRVLGRALERRAERLLDRALLVAERAGELADHRVADDHRRQLAARQDVGPDRHDVARQVLVHALVEALVAAAQQRQRRLGRRAPRRASRRTGAHPRPARSRGGEPGAPAGPRRSARSARPPPRRPGSPCPRRRRRACRPPGPP